MNIGVSWQVKEVNHPSFVEGRVGSVLINGLDVGIIGEVHPQVLEEWNLENPVAAFEIKIHEVLESKIRKKA